jgi:hypothetical protein
MNADKGKKIGDRCAMEVHECMAVFLLVFWNRVANNLGLKPICERRRWSAVDLKIFNRRQKRMWKTTRGRC